jgi:hypothetical protein
VHELTQAAAEQRARINEQRKPHLTAIARDAVGARYRFMAPMRAMIVDGTITGSVLIGERDSQATPGSPLLLDGRVALARTGLTTPTHNGGRLVLDFAALPGGPADAVARQCDSADAVTVSTEALANALRTRGREPVVLPDTVDPRDWTVQPRRAARTRRRLGWYGGPSVRGDALMLCEHVVRTLVDEVDFVFFNAVPSALTASAARLEYALPVPLALFPTLLAALDLDLLLTPLTLNAANECLSNLPLLQAGMLGYPVLATDIEPYRTLPVTRLPNTPAAWIAAIRNRIFGLPALRQEGETLRRAVHQTSLIGQWREHYFAAWTGQRRPPAHA